jgi:hypothetical protein
MIGFDLTSGREGTGGVVGGGSGVLTNSMFNTCGNLTFSKFRLGVTTAKNTCRNIEQIIAQISMLSLAGECFTARFKEQQPK